MTKIELAVDENPTGDLAGRYGIVAIVNGGVRPVGSQGFPSEDAAVQALCRALGQIVKS